MQWLKIAKVIRNLNPTVTRVYFISTMLNANAERSKSDIIWLKPQINYTKLNMELETGSALLIISKQDYRRHINWFKLKKKTQSFVNPELFA